MDRTPCPVCSKPLPEKRSGGRIRTYCSRACYLVDRVAKNRDIDTVVVDRLCFWGKVTSTRSERIEAVRILTEKGRSASWIAMLLRTTPRSIQRYRALSRLSITQKAA